MTSSLGSDLSKISGRPGVVFPTLTTSVLYVGLTLTVSYTLSFAGFSGVQFLDFLASAEEGAPSRTCYSVLGLPN